MIKAFLTTVAALTIATGVSNTAQCMTGMQPYSATVYGNRTATQGPEKWAYSVENTSDSADYTVWLVQIEVDEDTQVIGARAPSGWAVNTKVPHFITWMCSGRDVYKGESVSGFNVEFSTCPQYQNWSAMFNNVANPDESLSDGGIVRTAAVPEPTTMTAFLVGLAALARSRKRR